MNRIMQLTSNTVIPIMYQVPRKTYRDFHSDLYPETNGYRTDLTVTQWLKGVNTPVPKMSLDPARRELGDAPIIVSNLRLSPPNFNYHLIQLGLHSIILLFDFTHFMCFSFFFYSIQISQIPSNHSFLHIKIVFVKKKKYQRFIAVHCTK